MHDEAVMDWQAQVHHLISQPEAMYNSVFAEVCMKSLVQRIRR
jgi:hypothetical protein